MSTPKDILMMALEKETEARDFYANLAAKCSTDFVSDLLYRLENEESKHMKMIREMLNRMNAGHGPLG